MATTVFETAITDYKVADMALADWGRKEITSAWAASDAPPETA